MEDVSTAKLQPVILVAAKRLDCGKCKAAAIFVCVDLVEEEAKDDYNVFDYGAYCQACWQKYVIDGEE